MKIEGLVLGVLNIADEIDDQLVANKYRDFTISWSRYDYRDHIIEAATVDEILEQATSEGYRWCLILPYGHIVAEHWTPDHWQTQDFYSALNDLIDRGEFLVAGSIIGDENSWFGFENECVFVNLELSQRLSATGFNKNSKNPIEVPAAIPRFNGQRICALMPTGETELRQPMQAGWKLIASSLDEGIPVVGFDDQLLNGLLDLSARNVERTRAFAKYLQNGVMNYRQENDNRDLGSDQVAFLNMVQPQTTGARNGVFLWNIEAYTDIETPNAEFKSPLTSLYSVAAGFKPNRILHTHGCDESTRVVYFDYSPKALEIREYMVDHWDGDDFPGFVDQLFRTFPHPETFYQLWGDLTPDNVEPVDIQRMWQVELDRWGSPQDFRDCWQAHRRLRHEYVCCNILTDPTPLFARITPEPNAIIWWSNAFFTMFGNWHYSLEERQQMYQTWIHQIGQSNAGLFLFGSDYNNVNVNSVRAAEYWEAYQGAGSNCLTPCRFSKTEIRM